MSLSVTFCHLIAQERLVKAGRAAYLYIPEGHFRAKHFKVPHNTLVIGNGIGSWVHVDWPKDARARSIGWEPQSDMYVPQPPAR